MTTITPDHTGYLADIERWRQEREESLRAPDGWLSLTGLYWLNDGANSVGASPDCDVCLPEAAPARLGEIELSNGVATLRVDPGISVTVDGSEAAFAVLRDSADAAGPSLIQIGTITFFVIERGGQYAVRVRDSANPARLEFAGRNWFPVDESYLVAGVFAPHDAPRTLQIPNSAGRVVPILNPGRVRFALDGRQLTLEAFEAGDGELWFVFKDLSSGRETYGAGRFLYAPLSPDGAVTLDFNRAYHPPCAFTPFAACPLPPKENNIPLALLVGERL